MIVSQRRHAPARLAVLGVAVAAAVLALASPALASSAAPGKSGSTWGSARPVSTPATLPQSGTGIESVACAPSGYCAAVGGYTPVKGLIAAYAVNYKKGSWGKPEVINTTPLVKGPVGSQAGYHTEPVLNLVACPATGDCTAFGTFQSYDYGNYPFVINEKNGTWGKAYPVGGLPALGDTIDAEPSAVACYSVGNCVAAGNFNNAYQSENTVPFVVSEKNGTWGTAQAVPGTAAADSVDQGNIYSLSCTSAGTCLAVGFDDTNTVSAQFVAFASHGTWGDAESVPGVPATDTNIYLGSCAPSGTCTVLGAGFDGVEDNETFTVSVHDGTWGPVKLVPGTTNSSDYVTGLSCPATGDCTLAGSAESKVGRQVPFVATQSRGTWAKAQNVPGSAALDHGYSADFGNLACGAAGNCTAAGWANVKVTAKLVRTEAVVVTESKGKWGKPEVLPGVVKLDGKGNSYVNSVACSSAGHCAAGGFYTHNGKKSPCAFVASQG